MGDKLTETQETEVERVAMYFYQGSHFGCPWEMQFDSVRNYHRDRARRFLTESTTQSNTPPITETPCDLGGVTVCPICEVRFAPYMAGQRCPTWESVDQCVGVIEFQPEPTGSLAELRGSMPGAADSVSARDDWGRDQIEVAADPLDLTDEERDIMLWALGLRTLWGVDEPEKATKNSYTGNADELGKWDRLVQLGLAIKRPFSYGPPLMLRMVLTVAGMEALGEDIVSRIPAKIKDFQSFMEGKTDKWDPESYD